jgi:hypothetical protein
MSLTRTSIVAAVLNKYYSFNNPFGQEWTIWYLRESYTAILCANLPLIYPLIQRVFKLRNWNSGGNYPGRSEQRITPAAHSTQHSRPTQAHSVLRGTVRRTESQEIMGYSFNADRDSPRFITSAIDMDDLNSPIKASSEGSEGDGKQGSNPYHMV